MSNSTTILKGYKILDVVVVLLNVSRSPWGYMVRMETPEGEQRFVVSFEGLNKAGAMLSPTTQSTVEHTAVRNMQDWSNSEVLLNQLFARRNMVSGMVVIPYDVLARVLTMRFGKAYHVYNMPKSTGASVVIAPYGSAVKGVDLDQYGRPLVKVQQKGSAVQSLREPHLLVPLKEEGLPGVRLGDVTSSSLSITQASGVAGLFNQGEIEFMISHVLN